MKAVPAHRAVLALFAVACNGTAREPPAATPRLAVEAPMETVDVASVAMERSVQVTGMLVADERATLAFQVPGRVAVVHVDLGTAVKKGQLLASLDARDMELRAQQADALLAQARARLGIEVPAGGGVDVEQATQVRQARAVLEQNELNRSRVEELFTQERVAAATMEAAYAATEVARGNVHAALEEARNREAIVRQRAAEVDLARRQVAECRLLAPFDSAVETRLVSPGQTLQAGAPVMTVVRIDPLRARLDVPERHAGSLRAQQVVRLTMDGVSGEHPGVITRLAPVIDPQTRVVVVEAEVENDGSLRPGGLVRASLVLSAAEDALAVPLSAVTTFAGVEKVTVVEQGKTVQRTVTTGRRQGDLVEVLTGLKAGEKVVLRREPTNRPAPAREK